MSGSQICKAVLPLTTKMCGGLKVCNNHNKIFRMLTIFAFQDKISNNPSSFYLGRRLASKSRTTDQRLEAARVGSILQNDKYKNMKSELLKTRRRGFSLAPLEAASLHILSSKELKVNLDNILKLDALSLYSPVSCLSSKVMKRSER